MKLEGINVLPLLLTFATTLPAARAHWGNEASLYARKIRQSYPAKERLKLVKAFLIGPNYESQDSLGITVEGAAAKPPQFHTRSSAVSWEIRDSVSYPLNADVIPALFEAAIFTKSDGETILDGPAAQKILQTLDLGNPRQSTVVYDHLLTSKLPLRLMLHYVRTGDPAALNWFVRLLKESIARADAKPFGRQERLFGAVYGPIHEAWPAAFWNADSKRPAMKMMIAILICGLSKGLDEDLSEISEATLHHLVDQRVKLVTPLIRHIRDTPHFKFHSDSKELADVWHSTLVHFENFFHYASERGGLANDEYFDGAKYSENTRNLSKVIKSLHQILVKSAFARKLNDECGELLLN